MKTIIRNMVIYALILFFLPSIIPGFTLQDGFVTILIGSLVLTGLFLIIKPILTIITFPVNLVTVGLFTVFINGLLLYLLTVFVTDITIAAFSYHKATIVGFGTPEIVFNTFFAYLYTAFVLASLHGFSKWLMK